MPTKKQVAADSELDAISLFSNCGAGDVGFRRAGFRFRVMGELDPRRLEVALLNHPGAIGVPGDLRETWPEVVRQYKSIAGRRRPKLLCACPPCQGMSSARAGKSKHDDADAGSRDARNLLVLVIANVAMATKPDLIVVENVPAFLTKKVRHPETQHPISASNLLIEMLKEDYEVFPIVTDLSDFGVPQTRKRSFLTFIRKSVRGLRDLRNNACAPFPKPTHALDYGGQPITLAAALQGFELPRLDAASDRRARAEGHGGLHFVPIWDDRIYDMVSSIPPNTGRSAWENNRCLSCETEVTCEEAAVCPACGVALPRPVVSNIGEAPRLVRGFRNSSYRRMDPYRPAATITTASGHVGSDNTIHPFENRLLSPLECALIQSFPRTFKWGRALAAWGHTTVREMIGEAVPPRFTELHGRVLVSVLSGGMAADRLMPRGDRRCESAVEKLASPHRNTRKSVARNQVRESSISALAS